jgi:uncharacterized repeat protein (TIGR04138 family)
LWAAIPAISGTGISFCATRSTSRPSNKRKVKGVSVRHVTGPELLDGVRQYALKEFGPMVMTVFDSWGIRSCEDIGHMVFNLIGAGVFGKTEQDSIEDFKNVYDFEEAFVKTVRTGETGNRETAGAVAGVKASHVEQVNSARVN